MSEATGSNLATYGAIGLAAWQGREDEVRRLVDATMSEAVARGEGIGVTVTHWASALLSNGLGRYEDALAAAREAAKYQQELERAELGLDRVDRGSRAERCDRAGDRRTRAALRDDARERDGLGAGRRSTVARAAERGRCRGTSLSRGDRTARPHSDPRRSRARPSALRGVAAPGRSTPRRARAAPHAHDMFATIGMEAFAERARRELLATGEKRAKAQSSRPAADLTPQEAHIARLARDGLSNPEIGARLFISARTVEWHLRNVFAKLGISSRKQLPGPCPRRPSRRERVAEKARSAHLRG